MKLNARRLLFLVFIVLVWAGCVYLSGLGRHPLPVGEPTPAPQGQGWINLLDEAHAGEWANITDNTSIFALEETAIHIFGRTLHPLRYVGYQAQSFQDFELHLEFKVTPGANSGVFLRVQKGDPVQRGFEVQVLDDFGRPPEKHGSGAIYDVVTPMFNLARPAGEWNSYDIRVQGPEVRVLMNGWRVIDTDFSIMTTPLGKFATSYAEMPQEGFLALQDHGGEVWYRNIMIRPLPAAGQSAT